MARTAIHMATATSTPEATGVAVAEDSEAALEAARLIVDIAAASEAVVIVEAAVEAEAAVMVIGHWMTLVAAISRPVEDTAKVRPCRMMINFPPCRRVAKPELASRLNRPLTRTIQATNNQTGNLLPLHRVDLLELDLADLEAPICRIFTDQDPLRPYSVFERSKRAGSTCMRWAISLSAIVSLFY